VAAPKATQVREALKTLLQGVTFQGISASAPDYVVNLPAAEQGYGVMLDPSLNMGAVIGIAPDLSTDTRVTFSTMGVEMPVDVVVACKFEAPDLDPFHPPNPSRWDVQDELERAVKDRIRSDLKLGGLALDMTIPDTDKGNENTYVEKWAVVFLRVMVSFHHEETTA
jgi:hypothetical protein